MAIVVKLEPSNEPIKVFAESFNDALDTVSDNFVQYALQEYDDESLAALTHEDLEKLVDEKSISFDGDTFSNAGGAARRRAKRLARVKKRHQKAVDRVQSRVDRKSERLQKRLDKKALRKGNRAERKARRHGESPDGEMNDGAATNDAGTQENAPQSTDETSNGGANYSEDGSTNASSMEESGMGEQQGQGSYYGSEDSNNEGGDVAYSQNNSPEDEMTDGSTSNDAGTLDYNDESDGGDDMSEADSPFNGLDGEEHGSDLFESEIMSEAAGNRVKRKGGKKGKNNKPKKAIIGTFKEGKRVVDQAGYYDKTGQWVQSKPEVSQTDAQIDAISGEGASNFDGGAIVKSINWKMVGIGAVVAVLAIVVVKKFKLLK